MRKFVFAFLCAAGIAGLQISSLGAPKVFAQTAAKISYVCPMFCNQKTYEKAGACAVCGMGFVAKSAAPTMSRMNRPAAERVLARTKKAAIFIFDGVQIIDYAAPYEVFGQAGFEVFTVAEKSDTITTAMGMSVIPRYTFANHPPANILLLPGGGVAEHQNNPQVIKWIQDNAKQAEVVLSVCNGAFFLAHAGLLDGLEAWQADLFFIPNTGGEVNAAMPVTIAFAEKLKTLGINEPAQIVDAHHSRIATGEEFRETLRKGGYEKF